VAEAIDPPVGCSKWPPDKAAGEKKPEAYHSHPPNPELPEQLFSQLGYVEDVCDPRTKLAGIFSSLQVGLHEFAQNTRRIGAGWK
jgi:hypothetical protein